MFLALRLELSYSKKEILTLYAANAPFGGNIVGIDAASWFYFGRSAEALSWAEAAFLAVIPNDPGLIASAKSRQLLQKRGTICCGASWNANTCPPWNTRWRWRRISPTAPGPCRGWHRTCSPP